MTFAALTLIKVRRKLGELGESQITTEQNMTAAGLVAQLGFILTKNCLRNRNLYFGRISLNYQGFKVLFAFDK